MRQTINEWLVIQRLINNGNSKISPEECSSAEGNKNSQNDQELNRTYQFYNMLLAWLDMLIARNKMYTEIGLSIISSQYWCCIKTAQNGNYCRKFSRNTITHNRVNSEIYPNLPLYKDANPSTHKAKMLDSKSIRSNNKCDIISEDLCSAIENWVDSEENSNTSISQGQIQHEAKEDESEVSSKSALNPPDGSAKPMIEVWALEKISEKSNNISSNSAKGKKSGSSSQEIKDSKENERPGVSQSDPSSSNRSKSVSKKKNNEEEKVCRRTIALNPPIYEIKVTSSIQEEDSYQSASDVGQSSKSAFAKQKKYSVRLDVVKKTIFRRLKKFYTGK